MPIKINLVNPLFQSPYGYLQAAGSNASDGSASGIHLRWDFLRVLGDEHFAKGEYSTTPPYATTSGFNKPRDYVKIYRVAYNNEYTVTLNFNQAIDTIIDTTDKKEWDYTGFTPVPFDPSITTDIKVKFLDLAEYDTLKASVDPSVDPATFISQYLGVIEIRTIGLLKFKGKFDIKESAPAPAYLKVESISMVHHKFDSLDEEKFFVSSRKKMQRMDSKEDRTIICENIDRFRFQNDGAYPTKITLATYRDHVLGENGPKQGVGNWDFVGQFSLDDGNGDSNTEVFRRLEDIPNYLIDNKWGKYNERNPVTGEFTVKVPNYQDKWTDAQGLKPAVVEYLTLSATDVSAMAVLPSDDPNDAASAVISYLDMLKIVSLDFHVARMLGLGHIDKSKGREAGILDGGDTQGLLDFIADLANDSKTVKKTLENAAPLSEEILLAAINRAEPLKDEDLNKVLKSTDKLSDTVLLAALERPDPLKSEDLMKLLRNNSPLGDLVLITLINNPNVKGEHIKKVLQDSYPLSDKVLLELVLKNPLKSEELRKIMENNSPLSDSVLLAILNMTNPLKEKEIEDVFLENTPLSPIVEDALLNLTPPLKQKTIDNILNSTFVAGNYSARKCIYVMEYVTLTKLENVIPEPITATHVYMSLPTDTEDFRLPPEPFLKPVTYGLSLDNKSGTPTQITDDNGYTPFADERIVNIHREPFIFEQAFEDFFEDATEFDICEETPPVQYGLEYKKDTEPLFQRPELNHDPEFLDHSGIPETLGIPETGFDPMYIHQETKEGIHEYAAYSINWFSRISPNSNLVVTDLTKFPKRNTLLPPSNFAVQLVQEELPLIFTTPNEQALLSGITTADKTLVRATFDWNHTHHLAYQFADKVEFFHRENTPDNIKGKINTVTQLPSNQIQVTTTSYLVASTSPAQTVQPEITAGEEFRYLGSLFTVNGESFVVSSIVSTGLNPTFILDQIRQTNSTDPDNTNIFCTTETFISPDAGEIFMIVENMQSDNWDSTLVRQVQIEHFHTIHEIEIVGSSSSSNDGSYIVRKVDLAGTDTELEVIESISAPSATTSGDLVYSKKTKVIAVDSGTNTFTIEGDITTELSPSDSIRISASQSSDGIYTVTAVNANGTDTDVVVSATFTDTNPNFYLFFDKTITVIAIDGANKKFVLSGDLTAELIPPYREPITKADGTLSELLMGGVIDTVTITDKEDVDGTGTIIVGSKTGVYNIEFDNFQLPSHINPDIEWYKGMLRVLEDATQLPPPDNDPSTPNLTVPVMKSLNIWEIDTTGATLKLVVFDSTFNTDSAPAYNPLGSYVPIKTGSSVQVNFHPSYRLYLTVDTNGTNNFEESLILPATGDGSKQTLMSARAVDSLITDCYSYLATPVVLLAQEIVEPVPPGIPTGPAFATRPDFYGKSTYTFDVEVDTSGGREPYSLVFYRANERSVLDKLYKPVTVAQILNDLENLISPDADFFNDRWNGLVNADIDGSGLFMEYTVGGFRFPIPNNDKYFIADPVTTNPKVFPFDGMTEPGDPALITLGDGITQITMLEAVSDAMNGSFLPLSEQPVIYNFMETGTQTSGDKPTIRDEQDNILLPGDAGFDPFPMARKFNDGVDKVRFTDYTLDGAAKNFYFYFGVEMSNKMKISDRSPVTGPILLVNASPAEEPAIKKVTTQLQDETLSQPTAVLFKLNDYIESEGIKKVQIYRTTVFEDSQSVRSMDLAKTVDVGQDVIDDFSDVSFPLYGDPLFYRITALREIFNEQNVIELIPSKASKSVMTNVVDVVNPLAPCVSSENGTTTATQLQNVILTWEQACYNGTYTLQKMNASGNWEEVYKLSSNDAVMQYPPLVGGLPDFTNFDATAVLLREDADGNSIYHRFRVQVENSSGLFNLTDCPITLATGCFDLQVIEEFVTYADSNGFSLTELSTQEVDDGTNNNPGQITFTATIPSELPAGHNSFTQLDITLTDELGNTDTKSIMTASGTAVFNDGDGGLQLNSANHAYTITTKLITDFCTDGFRTVSTLSYVHGPCNDLSNLTQIVEITDSTQTYLLDDSNLSIDDGVAAPVSLTFTDISNVSGLTIPQSFTQLDVTVTDSIGNTDTKTINSSGGAVTFNDGDGGLVLNDGDINRNYDVSLQLITVQCATGQQYDYSLNYTYNPCNAVQVLTDIISFTDNSGASINPLIDETIDNGVHNPNGSITITDIVSGALPVGHTFDSMNVTLFDGNGGSHILPVTIGGSVIFNTGDGDPGAELDLGASNPNPTISVEVDLYTDLCTNGANFSYDLSYTYDPCVELGTQTNVVNFVDNNSLTIVPLESIPFNDGTNNNPDGSMTITETISGNLPVGDTFTKVDVTIEDGLGGTFTDEILSSGGSVTISNGQGGLVMDGTNPNRTYTISLKVFTSLCPDGVTFVYAGRYTSGV